MIRIIRPVFSATFRAGLIACAAYVYIEGAHPYLERRFAPVAAVSSPASRAMGKFWDGVLVHSGLALR